MADKKITELNNITGADLVDADEFVVVDISADETKAITFGELKLSFDGLIVFDNISEMAAATGLIDGQFIAVNSGFNSTTETFQYNAASTATADGALIVTAAGMGVGRLISTRKEFDSGSEVIADRRTFPDNTYLTVAGERLRAVSTGAQLSNVGGQGFVVANPGVGPSVSLFGAKLDLTDDTAPIQLALDAMASVGTVVGEYTPGGGTVHMEYGEARINGQLEFGSEEYLKLGDAKGGVLQCYASDVALSFGWNADGTVGQRISNAGLLGGRVALFTDGATAIGVRGMFGGHFINNEINLRGSNQIGFRAKGYSGIAPYYTKLDGLEVRGAVSETGNIGLVFEEDPLSTSAVSRGPNRWNITSIGHMSTIQHGVDIRAADGMTIGQTQVENVTGTGVRFGHRPDGPDYTGSCTAVSANKATMLDSSFAYSTTFANCAVKITSGANAGFCRNLFDGTTPGSLVFSQSWPYDFTIGDTFEVYKLTALNCGIDRATCETADVFVDFAPSAANCYVIPTMVTQQTANYIFKRGIERQDLTISDATVAFELETTIAASTTKKMGAFAATTRGGHAVGKTAYLDAITITGAVRGPGTVGLITAKVLVNAITEKHDFNGAEVDFTAVLTPNSPSDYTYVRRSLKNTQTIKPGENIHVELTSSADLVGTETVKVILHIGYL